MYDKQQAFIQGKLIRWDEKICALLEMWGKNMFFFQIPKEMLS